MTIAGGDGDERAAPGPVSQRFHALRAALIFARTPPSIDLGGSVHHAPGTDQATHALGCDIPTSLSMTTGSFDWVDPDGTGTVTTGTVD